MHDLQLFYSNVLQSSVNRRQFLVLSRRACHYFGNDNNASLLHKNVKNICLSLTYYINKYYNKIYCKLNFFVDDLTDLTERCNYYYYFNNRITNYFK